MTGAYVIMTEDCKRVENWVGYKRCKSNNCYDLKSLE